jgi:predicted LPLAT superfamily acyltransferase
VSAAEPPADPARAPAAPAAPTTHWARIAEAGAAAGLWFLYSVYCLGGRWLYRVLIWPVAAYFVVVRRVARHASFEYLARVGVLAADAPWWRRWACATRHVAHFADVLLDKALVWTGALDLADARIETDPRFIAAVEAGRGGLLVVSHHGNLEALRALGRRLPRLRLNILVHTRHAQRFNAMLARLNPASAANLLQVTELDAAVAALLASRVERGEFVVFAADRVPVSGFAHTHRMPFLGAPAAFPIGPWVIAAALRCPVYWLGCVKEADGRYTLSCELLHREVRLPRHDRRSGLALALGAYVQRLESACRAAPYAWFNFYPFWAPGDSSAPAPRDLPADATPVALAAREREVTHG